MKIVRTIVWVLLLVGLVVFSFANWEPTVTVRIWQGLVVDTKIPAIVIVSFGIGFVPMWLYYRASKWQTRRRIQGLESAARASASAPVASASPAPGETATTASAPEPAESPSLRPERS